MGVLASLPDHARYRCHARCRPDRRKTPPRLCAVGRYVACLATIALWLVSACHASETVRIATWAAPFSRDGPGLLLRDMIKRDDQLSDLVQGIADIAPDVLLLTDIDYDHDLVALGVLRDWIAERGPTYPHLFAARPNTGLPTGVDIDQDGRLGRPRDAQGWGRFSGQGGMAVLSRWPVGHVQDLSAVLWKDVPDSLMQPDDTGYHIQRLSSDGHWIVPIQTPMGDVSILAFHATPPVFDGPEDRNGRRNHDEIAFWGHVLNAQFGPAPTRFVVLGNANLDPQKGEGLKTAIRSLLARPDLNDPHYGQPTVDWSELGLGLMRVSYALPSATLSVADAGTAALTPEISPHSMVWIDVVPD